MNAPHDPFQGARPPSSDPFVELAALRLKYYEEKDGPNRPVFEGSKAEDAFDQRLWGLINEVEKTVMAMPCTSLAGVHVKLLILADTLGFHNRSSGPAWDYTEKVVFSVLDDVERLIGGAP
jgi:hypothetical protein